MTQPPEPCSYDWACEQITKYRELYPTYQLFAETVRQVLVQATEKRAPLAIVQARPKSIASFAEKAQRKCHKHADPVNQFTDLCGGRVITHTYAEVEEICRFVDTHFEVDRPNSVSIQTRLKPTEFGYRSVHYVVQFRPGIFPNEEVGVNIPKELYPDPASPHPFKAEIQVRTLLEHAWASFSHERVYKGAFAIPDAWQRELAGLAAMLEQADRAFSRIQAGLQTYAANYGNYMSPDRMREELELLQLVLECDPEDLTLAHRIGRLALALGDWDTAIAVLEPRKRSGYQPILRDLGEAHYQLNRKHPGSRGYRRGQKYLEKASAPEYRDPDALASLAGTYKGTNPKRARDLYRRAFEIDPGYPYAVSNYLVAEIQHRKDVTPLALMKPAIEAAMQRCRDQAQVGMNLPWGFYDLGMFDLLLDRPYDSLIWYAKAILVSSAEFMVSTSLRTLEQLAPIRDRIRGYEWVRRALLVALAARFPDCRLAPSGVAAREQLEALALAKDTPVRGPVVIAVGGTDPRVEQQMKGYLGFVLEAFRDFRGTLISGGTRSGIAGLVGAVQEAYPGAVHTIGYVPALIPAGTELDLRYREFRSTEGHEFSALETIQYWIDLIVSNIAPEQVRVLGIDGGDISAAEYRLALALGAHVAVVENSGRAVAELLADRDWQSTQRLTRLPADGATASALIGSGRDALDEQQREAIARAIHDAYRRLQASRLAREDPAMAEWPALQENLKDSNRRQADHVADKLRQIGCRLQPTGGPRARLDGFGEADIELLARLEHGRWCAERLRDGWTFGEVRDVMRKTSPSLVPWANLSEEDRTRNRNIVSLIPEYLAAVGLEVCRDE